ncbi:hypothetical protein [Halalkalibacter lacteus]|uniref:hypothetical protein n=1 Tax=Halalkalibacter lacteus TaxID=3090663 RepID=UPI002FC5E4DC
MFLVDIALILTLILSVLYPIILIFGVVISWRNSFKEGVISFILMLSHNVVVFLYDKTILEYYPTYTDAVLKILITLAISTLILGIYRRWK